MVTVDVVLLRATSVVGNVLEILRHSHLHTEAEHVCSLSLRNEFLAYQDAAGMPDGIRQRQGGLLRGQFVLRADFHTFFLNPAFE